MVLQGLVERCEKMRVLSLFDYRMVCRKRCILCWISVWKKNESDNDEIEMVRRGHTHIRRYVCSKKYIGSGRR